MLLQKFVDLLSIMYFQICFQYSLFAPAIISLTFYRATNYVFALSKCSYCSCKVNFTIDFWRVFKDFKYFVIQNISSDDGLIEYVVVFGFFNYVCYFQKVVIFLYLYHSKLVVFFYINRHA